jgi:predicted PurR-regulated permease PerM
MGIVGMIIALPLTTLIISYYQRWVLREGKSTENMVEISSKTAENQDV